MCINLLLEKLSVGQTRKELFFLLLTKRESFIFTHKCTLRFPARNVSWPIIKLIHLNRLRKDIIFRNTLRNRNGLTEGGSIAFSRPDHLHIIFWLRSLASWKNFLDIMWIYLSIYLPICYPVSWGCRMRWQHICSYECPVYDAKLPDSESQSWSFVGMWGTF